MPNLCNQPSKTEAANSDKVYLLSSAMCSCFLAETKQENKLKIVFINIFFNILVLELLQIKNLSMFSNFWSQSWNGKYSVLENDRVTEFQK